MAFHKIDGPVFTWYGPGGPVDPDYGFEGGGGHPSHPIAGAPGSPSHPIVLPPLPGVWPPPGQPSQPIVLPPTGGVPSHPIYIEGSPEHPIAQPPATIWPPLPPEAGLPSGKIAILIWVVGVGTRWLVIDKAQVSPPMAGTPEPKK